MERGGRGEEVEGDGGGGGGGRGGYRIQGYTFLSFLLLHNHQIDLTKISSPSLQTRNQTDPYLYRKVYPPSHTHTHQSHSI